MSITLASLGWDASIRYAYDATGVAGDPDHLPARVARVDRGLCTVFTGLGAERASVAGALLAAAARDPVALPCAGDWVVVRRWPDGRTTVERVLPRRTAIVRRTSEKDSLGQVLAANLDAAAVVEPVEPAPDLGRIERLLALAWESGATPLVIVTKLDLVDDPARVLAGVVDAAPGVEVIGLSATRGDGLDAVRRQVRPGRTLALLGPSGAGKSTMVNALVGAAVMVTRGLRRGDQRGRHTTTYRTLVAVPGGGVVLDTPGIRAVGLFDAEAGLDSAFSDIADLAATCRFADCRHDGEPGCAVRAALESGDLTARRLASWRKLQRELAYELRRRDARLAAEEKARWKRIQKDQRARSGRP